MTIAKLLICALSYTKEYFRHVASHNIEPALQITCPLLSNTFFARSSGAAS